MANRVYAITTQEAWSQLNNKPALFALHGGHVRFVLSTIASPHTSGTPQNFYAWSGGQNHRGVAIYYSSPLPDNQRSRLYDVEVYGQVNATWAGGDVSTSLTFQVSSLTESSITPPYQSAYIIMQDRAAPSERWWYLYQIDLSNILIGTYRAIVVYDIVPFLWRVMPPVLGSYPYPDYRVK